MGREKFIYGVDKYGFAGVCYKKSREGVDAECTRHVVGHTESLSSSEKLAQKYLTSAAGSKFATGDFARDSEDFVDDPDDDIISINEYGQASEAFMSSGGRTATPLSNLTEEEIASREAYSDFVNAKNRYGEFHPITVKLRKAMDDLDEDDSVIGRIVNWFNK